jgi:diguanylate cyclase (GGDEF)-like protein
LTTTRGIPARLSGHPYAAAIFAGATATGVVLVGYAAIFAFATGVNRLPPGVAAVDGLVAAVSLSFAWAVGTGRVSSVARLELCASIVLTLVYGTSLAEMVGSPARAEILTTHGCLILIAAGVVIRSWRVLLELSIGALVTWAVTTALIQAPHFSPEEWTSTWLITVAIAFSANHVARTERGVEHTVRRAAQSISWRDTLTGLANRRGFTGQAALVASLAERRREPIWCAFLDVDHFKSVNDLLGHDAGDEVLVAVATALRLISRSADLPCRWGGDEFLLLGSGEPPDEPDMEDRIAQQLSQLDHDILRLWKPAVTVGVASGLEQLEADGSIGELITAADHRMYERRERRRARQAATG